MPSNRIARLAEKRALSVRTGPYDLLMEGSGDTYGWVTSQVGPVRWGDFPSDRPAWYLGRSDGGGSFPIGPNGPWVGQESILPAVTRCTGIIASTMVRTRWTYTDARGDVLPRPLWVDDPMGVGSLPGVLEPTLPAGLRLDGGSFFETWMTHAIWWGLGAFVFVENSAGEPTAGTLRLINPYLVGIDDSGHYVIDPKGETPIRTNFDGRFIAGGKVWRIAVLRGTPPNDHRTPEGVLTRHFDTFRLGAAVSKYVANTFAGMGVPSGLLKVSTPGFKKPDADALKADWMAAHGSSKRSVAVLNSTVEYQPISITPVDMASESAVHITRADIAHAFGLSSIWLDEGACVDTETTAYTRDRGWVGHEDLHEGDEVLALDHETGLAAWSKVTAMNVFDVTDHPVVEYGSAYHSSVTTLKHRWPVLQNGEREWTTTGEGFDRDMSIVLGAPLVDLPTEAKFSDAFVELVAWFYTEGHWAAKKRNLAYISQSHAKCPAETARIRAALTALLGSEGNGWHEKREVGGSNAGMSVFRLDREASAPLLDLLGPGKVVPFDFIDSLTRAQLELFLHVSVLADGHHGKSGDRALLQKEPEMFAGFQRAALLLGIPAPVTRYEREGASVQHRISLPTRTTLKMRGQKVSVRLHTGIVWCPTTEHGTWLASRNGKPFFTGNSGLTYQNNTDRRRDLVDISLSHWSEATMAVLSSLMPLGTRVEVNWPTFTQPSIEGLAPPLVQAVQAGILTAHEARQYLGLVPSSGPDPSFHDNSPAAKEPQPVPPALAAYAGMPAEEEVTDDDAAE